MKRRRDVWPESLNKFEIVKRGGRNPQTAENYQDNSETILLKYAIDAKFVFIFLS